MTRKVELEIFENGNENSSLGTIRVPVFPGATIDIGDITIKDNGNIDYDREHVDITFNGQKISEKLCEDDRWGNNRGNNKCNDII